MAALAKVFSTLFLTTYTILILLLAAPLEALAQTESPSYLTIEILQEKATHLTQQDGRDTINLSNYIINLSQLDSEFTNDFYQLIDNTISRASNPINLNLSNSIIQGNFQLNKLGISSSLAEGTLSSLLTSIEKDKINQYYSVNHDDQNLISRANIFRGSLYFNNAIFTSKVDSSNSIFLNPIIANSANFQGMVNFKQTIFGEDIDFSQTTFHQNVDFSQSSFYSQVKFNQADFLDNTEFNNSQFEAATEFTQATFTQLGDFTRTVFIQVVDFSQAIFRDRAIFAKGKFLDSIIFQNSNFEKTGTFRDIYLNSQLNLQDAHILNQIDFSNAFFTPRASINVSGLAFDGIEAKIIGQPGIIGKFISVDSLQGNETVFRNLIHNFRSLEQITDANYLEYKQEQLRARQISDRVRKTSWQKVFTWKWISLILPWLGLNLLLLLGNYGTNINLLFSIGIITIAWFSFLFWIIDRYRPHISQPIIPNKYEIIIMLISFLTLTSLSLINIFITTNQPWLTIVTLTIVLIPIPLAITSQIYRYGRFHQLLNTTYFVEDSSFREFRLLLGRLPIIPRFPFYRDRYMPILWEKRWSWLNYYNLSLNNIFKVGFNDIRLRDQHLPGLISTLVWYQWCLGVLYIVLLLWTLSRTIPGLNLLIYF